MLLRIVRAAWAAWMAPSAIARRMPEMLELPVVATPEGATAHELLHAIREIVPLSATQSLRSNSEYHLKTAPQMRSLFEDAPEVADVHRAAASPPYSWTTALAIAWTRPAIDPGKRCTAGGPVMRSPPSLWRARRSKSHHSAMTGGAAA